MLSDLLPAPTAAPLCSVFSQQLGVRPAGTGLSLERVIIVATPLPWPKPALKHPLLQPAAQALAGSPVTSRLFAAEPWTDEVGVELYERRGTGFVRFAWAVSDEHELAALTNWIASTPIGDLEAEGVEVVRPTILVCTQASHDQCCGVYGEQLAGRIARDRPEIELRRVSHTGGHRFAPTLLALPSGRMWAYVDDPLVARIAAGAETAEDFRSRCRGWLGASTGAAQVAEIAARSVHGAGSAAEPVVEVETAEDGHHRCTVRLDDLVVRVVVRPGRSVPTIACEAPGGLPAKTATEYEWQVVEPAWS